MSTLIKIIGLTRLDCIRNEELCHQVQVATEIVIGDHQGEERELKGENKGEIWWKSNDSRSGRKMAPGETQEAVGR